MVDAQQIFESLIKDPNHYFLGEKAVEQEAIRRARQFHNNEKALAMALQNSAVAKLSTFLSKVDEAPLSENAGLSQMEQIILQSLTEGALGRKLYTLRPLIESYKDDPNFY